VSVGTTSLTDVSTGRDSPSMRRRVSPAGGLALSKFERKIAHKGNISYDGHPASSARRLRLKSLRAF
jgi:hypothetical protein